MTSSETIPREHLETVPCPLCRSDRGSILFEIRGFPIRRCDPCRTRYVSPRLRSPDLLGLYSQESYYRSDNSLVHGYVDYVADRQSIVRTFRKRLEWLLYKSRKGKPGRMLDVGCALGYTVEDALEQGWDAYGIEPSTYAADAARKTLGDRVALGTLDHHSFSHTSFDTILLWDVIEHVPDPLKTLEQVYDLLAPGGTLSLITPDCGSFLARVLGRFWMEYAKPTEHILFFSQKTMKQALQKTDFKTIARTTAGKYIGLNFILDRLSAHLPMLAPFKTKFNSTRLAKQLFYVNPLDKMHLLAVK